MSDKTAAEMSLPELLRTHMPVSDGAIMSYMAGDVCERAASEIEFLTDELKNLLKVVDRQAEDPGLWVNASSASEAYIQHALRELHDGIEIANNIINASA